MASVTKPRRKNDDVGVLTSVTLERVREERLMSLSRTVPLLLPAPAPGSESVLLGLAVAAPALEELARERSGVEAQADAELLVVDLEVLGEAELVLAHERRRVARAR